MSSSAAHIKKRLVLCCDGTWMDSDDGYNKPTLIPYVPTGTLQIPSNVTRISRGLKKAGLDGSPQIIYYHSGVGTGPGFVDAIGGGLLGTGISENIREVYSFVAANYTPGDDIILIGFSRGAFTARSVAAMIGSMGLLTRTGMSSFYPIFKDYENFLNPHYNDIFPTIPFPNKPKGSGAAHDYKRRLEAEELTRVYDPDGTKIRVQSVAVWDTVGSLGIPQVSWLARMGLPHSTKEYRFNDTNLDGTIRHAFQALALDEHRNPFSPAVWERMDMRKCTVDLRQVWFPGAHSNVGGGYDDQEIANISLAWMMDQLASIGVAFQSDYIDQIFADSIRYYYNPRKLPARVSNIFARPVTKQWAIEPVFEKHKPVRPWGLGEIYESEIGFYKISGKRIRTPGMNCRADPQTGIPTDEWMTNTNERIHRCVRVRLELEGLDLDDRGIYKATALQRKGMWRLAQTRTKIDDPIPWDASWGPGAPAPAGAPEERRWVWEYDGPDEEAPPERTMVEEPLGPYERKLILLNKGRSFYRRFLPSKRRRRKSHKSGAGAHSPEDDSLVDAPVREEREKEKHRDRRNSRYRDDGFVEEVVVVREKIPRENGHSARRQRERSRYRQKEEDEESLVDSVDRNEAEKIVRRRERDRRNGPVPVFEERERVREKRREFYERERD